MARKTGSHAEITGPKIREAALRLFARSGYAAVSMRQIAAEVGVQAGALYTYTPDKQALLFDLMRGHMEELLMAWRAEDVPEGPVAALEHFTRFHIRYHLARPDEVFVSYMELRSLPSAEFAVVEDLRRGYEDVLFRILTRGAAEGVFDVADPKVATWALIAMLTGVGTWFSEGGRLERSEVEELYWGLVARTVGLGEEAARCGVAAQ